MPFACNDMLRDSKSFEKDFNVIVDILSTVVTVDSPYLVIEPLGPDYSMKGKPIYGLEFWVHKFLVL